MAAMKLEPFEMERLQSTYEHQVEFNLSESGVHPVTLGELVDDGASRAALLAESLRYTQTNGTDRCASRSRRPTRARPPITCR